jgi:hypothetical protein
MLWILLVTFTVLGLIVMAIRIDISKAVQEETVLPQGQCTPSRNALTHPDYKSRRIRWHALERHVKESEQALKG